MTPEPTDADRAWAAEQVAKHGPVPTKVAELMHRLRSTRTRQEQRRKAS